MPETTAEKKKKLILLCGPIAAPGKPAGGGFQSGNRRVSDILQRQGYDVEEMPYPEGIATQAGKASAYGGMFLRLCRRLLTGRRPDALQMSPLVQHFLPAEAACCLLARLRGVPVVLDLRAGIHLDQYRSKGGLYRFAYRLLLRQAGAISYQGEVYADLVSEIAPRTPAWYLPNFIARETLPAAVAERPSPLHLIYVGQVSFAKGAFHAAKALSHLQQAGAVLTLAGSVDEDCRQAIAALNVPAIRFTGPLPPAQVRSLLDQAHFFIFLSHWWGEGHSNALTEAMAHGCVPVFTRQGFNEAVAGGTGIRVDDREDAAAIANDILALWSSGRWREMAENAQARVRTHYSSERAEQTLGEIYLNLWNQRP